MPTTSAKKTIQAQEARKFAETPLVTIAVKTAPWNPGEPRYGVVSKVEGIVWPVVSTHDGGIERFDSLEQMLEVWIGD
jgi:hypothetical protein|nr:hypothetical protein [Neorhizobium tomejilense]